MFNYSINFSLFLTISLNLWAQSIVPQWYKYTHNLVSSLAVTTYYTLVDANRQNSDASSWKLDGITWGNIAWRTVLFGGINYLETDYMPSLETGDLNLKTWQRNINLAKSSAGMLSYNSRYEEVVLNRYNNTKKEILKNHVSNEEMSSVLSGLVVFLRNVAWFYTVPPLLSGINLAFNKKLNADKTANWFYQHLFPVQVFACAVYSISGLIYQNLLISIKDTVWQFLPKPETPFSIARFDDCTACYFGTNLMGKNGMIGSYLYGARRALLEFWREPIGRDLEEDL